MYVRHFNLTPDPFSIAPDPRFLFMSERHREALAHLLFGVKGTGGVVLLTGEIGTGKTTVCRCLREQIPGNCHVAIIFNPKRTVIKLLQSILVSQPELRTMLERPDLDLLAEHGIALGICPTPNLSWMVYPSIEARPNERLRRAGVRVSVNTDAPALLGKYALCQLALACWQKQKRRPHSGHACQLTKLGGDQVG